MKAPFPVERPAPRLRSAVAVSMAFHLVLLAAPAALWRAVMPGPATVEPRGLAGSDFMVVSLADAPEPSAPRAEASAPPTALAPEVIPPRQREEPPVVEVRELPVAAPATEGTLGAGGGEVDGSVTPDGSGGGGDGIGGETSARYQPPRLLAGALPLTPQESEALPSPLEIPVRLRIGRDGQVTAVEPAALDLPAGLREALQRSARTMRFVPARLGAEPVEAWFSMTFIYRR